MIAKLEQKRGIYFRRHTLYEDKVIVEVKNARKVEKYEVAIDKLGYDLHYQADNTIWGKWFLAFCITLPIILTIVQLLQHNLDYRSLAINYTCWFGMAIFGLLKQNQDDIFLLGGEKNLIFYRNKPTELEVLNFIEKVVTANKAFLKTKYLQEKTSFFDDSYIDNLTFLKDRNVISEEEFQSLKREYEIKWYN